jgi:hypothetical protein
MRQQQQVSFLQSLTSAECQNLHSRYAKRYYKSLSICEQYNRSRWVPWRAVQDPQFSACQKLLSSNDDQSLITLTGFNCQTFNWLNESFTPYCNTHSPHVSKSGSIIPVPNNGYGCLRLMLAADCLGLCLAWTRTTGPLFLLHVVFGMTKLSCLISLQFGCRFIIHFLHNNTYAKIAVPTVEKF